VAKILVADDNSNIQKMVGLALKDHGIEVVAVGNGEAAVRKISDVRPDLVLADVFMPVRNGYEVCKYVKEDAALSHIPVILLVGAFDPLDEQEAQRVGADGVLKKPFVPPDPLISMVKSALVRAGVAHTGFTPAPAQVASEHAPPEPQNPVPTLMALPKAELPIAETESFVEEVPARPAALKIESGSQPVAFGSLLETPGTETEENPGSAPAVHPALAQERDWRSRDAEDEEEEEPAAAKSSWRRDAGGAGEETVTEEVARSASGWRDAAEERASSRSSAHEAWTPTREKQDLASAAEIQGSVTAVVTETQSTAPAAPFAGDAWAAAISAGSDSETAVAEAEKPVEEAKGPERYVSHDVAAAGTKERELQEQKRTPGPSPVVGAADAPVMVPEKPSTASSWFSTAPSPWDAEVQKASQLASTWDAPVIAPVRETGTAGDVPATSSYEPTAAPDEIEVVSEVPVSMRIPAKTVEALREEASQAVERAAQQADRANDAREAAHEAVTNLDLDAVVAKVMARMSPEVLQSVTRDILKPVIEAIVREELNAKKP
jgi:CheY-like chemotaxis protein